MHTVELLEQAIDTASRLGYNLRHEFLGGVGGGGCEFGGSKWLFVDLALGPFDQLDQVCQALASDPSIHVVDLPDELRQHLNIRQAA